VLNPSDASPSLPALLGHLEQADLIRLAMQIRE